MLNAAQQQAVDYIEGPLLVLAGPGTGKTQLLSHRVAHILEATDTNPENILCLTFTDAGADNMRRRLTSMIGKTAASINIFTYHSFGTNILAQYKNYAENFSRNLDNPIDTVTQYRIIEAIVEKLPALDILKTARIQDIIATISEAKSARLSASDLRKIAKTNIEDTNAMNSELSDILDGIAPRMKYDDAKNTVYLPLAETIAKYTSAEPITGNIMKEANALLKSLTDIIDAEDQKEKPSVSPLTTWRNKNFEKDSSNNWRLSNLIANKKLLSFSNVMELYEKYLEENSLFDFADMIQQAIKALSEDDGFRFTLQERYQYILLDEFQDTNPSQFELVRLLSDYENPNIMAVGDDDQAIFAFQGANASNLIEFQNLYNAKIILLNENYRSTSEILDFSHKIADQISDSFAKERSINKTLTSVLNDSILEPEPTDQIFDLVNYDHESPTEPEEKHSFISRHEFLAADAEYAWVANQIHKLIQAGEKQSEIAILTEKHKYFLPLLPYLKAYDDINIAYEKRENILEDKYIHEITTLARFIYELSQNQNPAYRLMEILTFPFFGIPPITAISALQTNYGDAKKSLDYLLSVDDEKLKQTAAFVAELVKLSFDTPLEEFIDYLIGTKELSIILPDNTTIAFKSPFLDAYSNEKVTDFNTFNLYENLTVLRENIRSHIKTEKPRLKDFINFLDDYEAAGQAILNTSPYQDSSDSVQIMSAHKSKGLEFKHVFMIATDDVSWGKGKGNNNLLSLPKNLASIRHTGITEDEQLRLLFVAITRARKTLTITNSKQDFAGKTPKRLIYLEEYDATDSNVVSPLLPNPNVIEHYDELSPVEKQENIQKNWLASYLNPTPALRPLLEARLEHYTLTATDLTTFIDIAYAGPLEFYRRRILHGPQEPATDSMIFGTLIHAVFEAITKGKTTEDGSFRNLSDEEAIQLFKELVEKQDIDDKERQDLLDRGLISLQASLESFGAILRAQGSRAEVNLGSERITYSGIPITGMIDHINIDEEAKTIEIYDFKTGGFHKEQWDKHATLYKYALQLGFYKLMLNNSPTYRNYKITKAHILFVSPSVTEIEQAKATGNFSELVHDKVYEFNDAEETDLKELVVAVYNHVKKLDFIEDGSELAVYPDETKKIKDIKDFCELIKSTS